MRSGGAISAPSTAILSPGPTLKAGLSSTRPLTLTRPAATIASASRREAMPARASRLAMRSCPAPASAGRGALRVPRAVLLGSVSSMVAFACWGG